MILQLRRGSYLKGVFHGQEGKLTGQRGTKGEEWRGGSCIKDAETS